MSLLPFLAHGRGEFSTWKGKGNNGNGQYKRKSYFVTFPNILYQREAGARLPDVARPAEEEERPCR